RRARGSAPRATWPEHREWPAASAAPRQIEVEHPLGDTVGIERIAALTDRNADRLDPGAVDRRAARDQLKHGALYGATGGARTVALQGTDGGALLLAREVNPPGSAFANPVNHRLVLAPLRVITAIFIIH